MMAWSSSKLWRKRLFYRRETDLRYPFRKLSREQDETSRAGGPKQSTQLEVTTEKPWGESWIWNYVASHEYLYQGEQYRFYSRQGVGQDFHQEGRENRNWHCFSYIHLLLPYWRQKTEAGLRTLYKETFSATIQTGSKMDEKKLRECHEVHRKTVWRELCPKRLKSR